MEWRGVAVNQVAVTVNQVAVAVNQVAVAVNQVAVAVNQVAVPVNQVAVAVNQVAVAHCHRRLSQSQSQRLTIRMGEASPISLTSMMGRGEKMGREAKGTDGVNTPPDAEPAPPADDGTAPPPSDGNDQGYSPDDMPFDLKTTAHKLSGEFEQAQMWQEIVYGERPLSMQEFMEWQQRHGGEQLGRTGHADDDQSVNRHLVATYGDAAAKALAARDAAWQAQHFASGVFDPVETNAGVMFGGVNMVGKGDGFGDGS